MARKILLAWELGGGSGHAARLAAISDIFVRHAYEPVLAVQRADTVHSVALKRGTILEAPLWPGLHGQHALAVQGPQASFGDTLGDLGLDDPATVEFLIGEWERLIGDVQPVALVADFAPAALLTAYGRLPTIAIGNGYTLPPTDARTFALLKSDAPRKYDEQALLRSTNAALRRCGRGEIDRLPAIFSADRNCITTFVELDPYAPRSFASYLAPTLSAWSRKPDANGNEIFVYLPEYVTSSPAILASIETVARHGKPVRLFIPKLDSKIGASLSAAGVAVETQPVRLDEVAQASSLIVSHGGLGMTCFALAAGIPHAIVAWETEKALNGQAVERLGAGRYARPSRNNPLEATLLAQFILETAENTQLATTAKAISPRFAARLTEDPVVEIAMDTLALIESRPDR
jgi:hypothetical protein